MPASAAREFVAQADFDDPLVVGSHNDADVPNAGEDEAAGRALIRLLVTNHYTAVLFLLLDPATYCILARGDERMTSAGKQMLTTTEYAVFRPAGG